MRVRNDGTTLVVQESGADVGGDYVTNLRFDNEQPKSDGIASRLAGFSGGFVKNSVNLQRTLTVQYVPLPKADQVVSLECGALLPGLDKARSRLSDSC